MHITNDVWRKRPGYDYQQGPNGEWIGWPKTTQPVEKWPTHGKLIQIATVMVVLAITAACILALLP